MINSKANKRITWFSRLLRWGLGLFFLTTGIIFFKDGAWPVILFGLAFIVSGFFTPKRCLDDKNMLAD